MNGRPWSAAEDAEIVSNGHHGAMWIKRWRLTNRTLDAITARRRYLEQSQQAVIARKTGTRADEAAHHRRVVARLIADQPDTVLRESDEHLFAEMGR